MSLFGAIQQARTQLVQQAAQDLSSVREALDRPMRPYPQEAVDNTDLFTKTNKYRLRAIQAWALDEIRRYGGLFGPIGVGHGKTIISFLAPEACRLGGFLVRRPLLLAPAPLVEKATRERFELIPHLKVDGSMRILSYSSLSSAKATDLLERLRPDLIVCDEAHKIARKDSSRARRLRRYAKSNPDCRFVFLSGSFTVDSIEEYEHLLRLALRDNTPTPSDHKKMKSWAKVLSPDGKPKGEDYVAVRPLIDWHGAEGWAEGEDFSRLARQAYRHRLLSTPGVVATSDSAIQTRLVLEKHDVSMPEAIEEELDRLETTWCRADGEELEDAIAVARNRQHLLQGFYHVWDWPEGKVDEEWMEKRAAWHKAVRGFLQSPRAVAHRDSPLLLRRWVMRGSPCSSCSGRPEGCFTCGGTGRVPCDYMPLVWAWEEWNKVRHRPQPPTKVIWLDKFLVEEALDRATAMEVETGKPVIIWTVSKAMFEALAEHLPAYGPGDEPPRTGAHTCVMSVRSHGTGRNLQAWSQGLLTLFIGNNNTMEQLLGRTHRPGQEAASVTLGYLSPSEEYTNDMVQRASAQARYVEDTQSLQQKLLMAEWVD